ncbi:MULTISPECIES: hypothetical protein [Flavobacteriaceae]|uniref:hypothetical protein n=1 Tax=Flavobacteriaceae TaxID=49546 RepID=UPI0039E9E84F
MSKTKINKVLIIVVFFIWGGVVYKIFFNNNEKLIEDKKVANHEIVLKKSDKKTIELFLRDEDPFLGKITRLNKKVKKEAKKSKKKKKRVTWPMVRYLGVLKKGKNDELALLKVRGSFVKSRKREKIENYDFLVYKIYRDSVVLKQGIEKKTIKR